MTTRSLASLMQRVGILAVATAIAVVGGNVRIAAAMDETKVGVCHVVGDGGAHMINISVNAEPAHRAHGDARPGEPVPTDTSLLFDAECKQVPRPVPVALLACPCWNKYTQATLVGLVTAVSGKPWCLKSESFVSLSADQAVSTLVYATSAGMCVLKLNGANVVNSLTPQDANQCLAEATALLPSVSWCAP